MLNLDRKCRLLPPLTSALSSSMYFSCPSEDIELCGLVVDVGSLLSSPTSVPRDGKPCPILITVKCLAYERTAIIALANPNKLEWLDEYEVKLMK